MADEREGSEEAPPSISKLRILISKAGPPPSPPSPPPLVLPVANADEHLIRQSLELGKLALTLATTATMGLLFSNNFLAAAEEVHYLVVVGFMAGCAVLWNGILFGKTSLQLLGITLILLCFYGLVGTFLPPSFSWPYWILGALSLIPSLYHLIKTTIS